jgi:lipoprotein NlpI
MGTIKFGRLILAVMCWIFFVSVVNCYGANDKAEEFYEHGKRFSSDKNSDHAIYNYSKAIKLNPKMVKAYNNRGIAYVWRKQYDLAIADFNTAIKFDPNNGQAYNNRAIAYWYKGENDKARQDVQKAQSLGISVNPDLLKTIQEQPSSTQ